MNPPILSRPCFTFYGVILASVVFVSALLPMLTPITVSAQERERDAGQRRELAAKIELLLERADAFQDEGRIEAAKEVLSQARELTQRLGQLADENREQQLNPEHIAERLELGISALRALGRLDMAEQLQRVRNQLSRELDRAPRTSRQGDSDREQQREDRAWTERRERERQQARQREERRETEESARDQGRDRTARERQLTDREMEQRKRELEEQMERRFAQQRERARERDRPDARNNREQEFAEQLEILRMARKALMEAERRDAADLMEQMIHSAELRAEGRSADDVHVPNPGQQIELLILASKLWSEFGNEDRAHVVANYAEQLQEKFNQRREADQLTDRQINVWRKHLDIMRTAVPALKEKGREDTLKILQRAMHAQEIAIAGRRDEEAAMIRDAAPPLAEKIEILAYAADLWKEFGDESKAEALDELANHYREAMQEELASRKRREDEALRPQTNSQQKIAELEERILELRRHAEQLQKQIRQRDRDR